MLVFYNEFFCVVSLTRKVLSMACSADAMCGDALKLLFKFQVKAYARKGTITPMLAATLIAYL